MLTAIDFDYELPFEAYEVENEVLKWDLPSKFEERQPPAPEQAPHRNFSVGCFVAHRLCETADALGCRPMVRRLRREPLTRRLTS